METIMIIKNRKNVDLIFESDINHHYTWYTKLNKLGVIYYENFKYRVKFDSALCLKIQNSFLNYIENDLNRKINNCYIFLAIENYGTRIEKYYKVWKKNAKIVDLNIFNNLQEIQYKTQFGNYYVGLAKFDKTDLKLVLLLQKSYRTKSFILINTKDSDIELNIEKIASEFLKFDSDKGFDNIISNYCEPNIMITRIGDGGEDYEIAFFFLPDSHVMEQVISSK
jgi:hypothetical protein